MAHVIIPPQHQAAPTYSEEEAAARMIYDRIFTTGQTEDDKKLARTLRHWAEEIFDGWDISVNVSSMCRTVHLQIPELSTRYGFTANLDKFLACHSPKEQKGLLVEALGEVLERFSVGTGDRKEGDIENRLRVAGDLAPDLGYYAKGRGKADGVHEMQLKAVYDHETGQKKMKEQMAIWEQNKASFQAEAARKASLSIRQQEENEAAYRRKILAGLS